jgi:C4-dicarboxylate transporter DctM subunit
MEPLTASLIGIGVLLLLLFLGIHVGISLAFAGFIGQWLILGDFSLGLSIFSTTPYSVAASFAFTMLPLFVLMGIFSDKGGISRDAYEVANKWVIRIPGGLAIATVAANAVFAATCGVSSAAAAIFSKIAYPEMKKYGYQKGLALGSIAAGGTLAVLIPPSILMVLYGVFAEVSVGKLMLAGFIPGIILALFLSATIYIRVKLNPSLAPAVNVVIPFKEKLLALRKMWGVFILVFLVIGGIYGGIFTPTEAGALGAFGAFVICLATRRLGFRDLASVLLEVGSTIGMIYLIFIGAQIFSRFLAVSGLPGKLIEVVTRAGLPPMAVMAAIVVLYLILGMLIDGISALLCTIPILCPISQSLGWDPVWFGIVLIVLIEIGLCTPPFAANVFMVKSGAPDATLEEIFRGVFPMIGSMFIFLILIIAFPGISLFLPNLMK